MTDSPPSPAPVTSTTTARTSHSALWRVLAWVAGIAVAAAAAGAMLLGVAVAMAYPNLPDVSELADYRPKLPLRIYARDGELIGEFGEQRRNMVPFAEIPPVMINAVLAIEDARFFEHGGVDYRGMVRAALANLTDARSQGASTITMQLARNVYLTNDKTYLRKFYEVLLTYKLERLLTKEQILEIYMNQIFLGHRSYGFAAAAQTYFGKSLQELSIAEAAMLAGLPKAPSAFNPISNPRRARIRQLHIIDRMVENGFITAEQASAAREEPLNIRPARTEARIQADHISEMVRQAVFEQYGEDAYTRGLRVYTTIDARAQRIAHRVVRLGVLDFERRQFYRGPERFIDLPSDPTAREALIDQALLDLPDNGELMTAVVLEAAPRRVVVVRGDNVPFEITGNGLSSVRSGLAENAPPHLRLRPGAVVRVVQGNAGWYITQKPEVETAFAAVDPRTGEIRAMVGGFDFQRNQFNRATQAQRQPGSSFKPFIYSAALERGITPATLVNDAPLFFSASQTGGRPWEPRNYDGKFDGPMTVRTALARSKNMVSIKVLQAVGTSSAQEWVTRFGFDAADHPPFLTMALGAGAVTPLEMATGYGVFANGGYYMPPTLITRITDHQGNVLLDVPPRRISEAQRAIPTRNAFITSKLLQEITRSGTAARAQATLRRPDVYGKTGTTNDSVDAWFVGYHPTLSAAVWMGYDNPRNLGRQATGGALSLPIWIQFMSEALRDVPVQEIPPPPGVSFTQGEWFYDEFQPGLGVASLGIPPDVATEGPVPPASAYPGDAATPAEAAAAVPPMPEPQERRNILDLFRQQ